MDHSFLEEVAAEADLPFLVLEEGEVAVDNLWLEEVVVVGDPQLMVEEGVAVVEDLPLLEKVCCLELVCQLTVNSLQHPHF